MCAGALSLIGMGQVSTQCTAIDYAVFRTGHDMLPSVQAMAHAHHAAQNRQVEPAFAWMRCVRELYAGA